MTNSQEHITTELKKSLEDMIILPSKNLTNLIFIIIGIIAMELKDVFSKGTETSALSFADIAAICTAEPIGTITVKADCLEMCYKTECSGRGMSGKNAVRGAASEFGAGSNQ